MRVALSVLFLSLIIYSCAPVSRHRLNKTFKQTEARFQDHTGFMVYDLEKKKTIYEYNAAKYFTPASNTKIFTLFASLQIIGDSIPALTYVERGDSLIFWGTGDPSFLYKNVFADDRVYEFLRSSRKPLYFSSSNFHTAHFGSGWAWDDYNSAYSAERSPFPVYGNVLTIKEKKNTVAMAPRYFNRFLRIGNEREKTEVIRSLTSNEVVFYSGGKKQEKDWDIPFKVDQQTIADLLADTLQRSVTLVNDTSFSKANIFYSVPADSLYRVMMQDSDNFIAEQLLMICAGILSDSLQPEIAIKYVQKNFLQDLKDKPIWIDGSGLSRYNLFTPRSIVLLWEKIYQLVPRDRLFPLLAVGGKTGTIKHWYKADQLYIFGKTGTLSNNHCLSGYLVTKSGKVLIFSFMNNNFTSSTSEIRKNMQAILNMIYEKY